MQALGSPRADAHLAHLLESPVPGEPVNRLEKIGDRLPTLCRLPGPQLGRVSFSGRFHPQAPRGASGAGASEETRVTLRHREEPPAPVPLRSPSRVGASA